MKPIIILIENCRMTIKVYFEDAKIPQKIKQFNLDLENKIKSGSIKTDIDAYKFALKSLFGKTCCR